MLINVTDVLLSENLILEKEVQIELQEVEYFQETYRIKEKSPVKLILSNISQGTASIEGTAQLTITVCCDRCLKQMDNTFELFFQREVIAPIEEMTEAAKMEQWFMEGYHLNVDELIYNEILINWPAKVLCKQSCKGICSVCGINLNESDCKCDTFVPDPRMAVIKDIFNANKEV